MTTEEKLIKELNKKDYRVIALCLMNIFLFIIIVTLLVRVDNLNKRDKLLLENQYRLEEKIIELHTIEPAHKEILKGGEI